MNRARQRQIVIRVNDDELSAIQKKVEQSGVSQQQFLINSVSEKNIINTDGIKSLIPELKRIGNNLNQITKKCNEGSVIDDEVLCSVQIIGKELNEAWRLLRQLAHGRVSGG